MDSAILFQAKLAKTATKLQTKLLILEEALVGVTAHFKVSPLLIDLLLNTVYDLLNLLVLNMGLDQLATADSFGVTKDAGGSAEVLICSCDVFGRAQDEAVLGRGVPTGDCLTGDGFIAGRFDGEGALLDHARLDVEIALRHFDGIARSIGKREIVGIGE